MSGIVWLASYPKSGNTWLRALFTNYLSGADTPADINNLLGAPMASSRARFDEWVGVEASALDPAVIDQLRPEVYRHWAREAAGTIFIKVHDAWSRTDTGVPLFPADVTLGTIYVIRSPLDLAASCAHHWGIPIEAAVGRMCDDSSAIGPVAASSGHGISGRSSGVSGRAATRAKSPTAGLPTQLQQKVGSWSHHVQSWVDSPVGPVHVVRYEDLNADPAATFGAAVRFTGLHYDEDEVRKAVKFSSFTEMQRQETSGGFAERSPGARGGFFRHGKAGSWTAELPSDLAEILMTVHRETMERFGYAP